MKLAAHSHTLDTKFQAIQNGRVKAMTLLTRIINRILATRPNKDSRQNIMDDSALKQMFKVTELTAYSIYKPKRLYRTRTK